ncbi:hypothetical protein O1611_g5204 [Lasiodiplodia mahajangana]|uniref:Uncharacterized protein n=1 Tax=Lasiodiplodia mahajangana TaxID=1108764 RepID=A0ACC2JLT6_9PEZI|nr:hypothetical protein O1611_g5204 [Lasiodiplodia mahajangana]
MADGPEPNMAKYASLLGIPRELRQQIYGYVMHFDLKYDVMQFRFRHIHPLAWSWRDNRYVRERLCLGWVNLRLTCRLFNFELAATMDSAYVLNDEANRTYTLDITASEHPSMGEAMIMLTTWRKIPCCPSNASTLAITIYINVPQIPAAWTTGELELYARPLVRQLCNTVGNYMTHGPLLGRHARLQGRMGLKKLELNYFLCEPPGGINSMPTNQSLDWRWSGVVDQVFEFMKSHFVRTGRLAIVRSWTPAGTRIATAEEE